MRFCLVCAQATRFLCQMWTGMEQWVNGLAALLRLQGSCGSHSNPLSTLYSGQEGLGRVASGLESISALPKQHSVPLPWSCSQHSVSAGAKPSSAAQGRCLPSPAWAVPGCAQVWLTGAPWVPRGPMQPCSCSDPSWVCPEPTDWDWLGHVSSRGCGELPRLW